MFKWTNFFRGFAMGVTETVPGVSASTIAMLMGIYEQLLGSLSDITKGNIKRALGF
ncbi:membrane protein [Bacillus sp. JCM 19047]|nr:membrane protein [Bacillus sp. JCM 19047]